MQRLGRKDPVGLVRGLEVGLLMDRPSRRVSGCKERRGVWV